MTTPTPPPVPPVPPVPPPPAPVPLPPPPGAVPPPPRPLLPPPTRVKAPPRTGPPAKLPGLRGLVLLVGGIITAALILGGTLQIVAAFSLRETDEPVAFAGPVRRVVVVIDAGAVEIQGGDRATVTGTRHVNSGFARPHLDESVVGDTLWIRSGCGGFHMVSTWCGVSYTLDVPRAVSVEARSSAGNVTVAGVDGDVEARSEAGVVRVTDVGGSVEAHSSAGRIEGSGLRGPVARAETSAGRVTLSFAAAPSEVTARSAAGNVEIEVPADGIAYRVEAHSTVSAAEVTVPLDPRSDRTIEARTSAGRVVVTTSPS
jgi:hypothetical protein